jgi:hypothetical protein
LGNCNEFCNIHQNAAKILTPSVPGSMGRLCQKLIICPNTEILRYTVSKSHAIQRDYSRNLADMRRKLNALEMVVDGSTHGKTSKDNTMINRLATWHQDG